MAKDKAAQWLNKVRTGRVATHRESFVASQGSELVMASKLRVSELPLPVLALGARLPGLLALLLLLIPATASAHDGPPFPILVDQKVGPCMISVWTDPDVGTGTFFVIVSALPGSAVPGDLKVEISVQPTSGRLPEAFYSAAREDLSGQIQYKALVPFDAQELWRVRVRLQSAESNGEATATVEPTPPGLGRWDLLVYLLPFLAVGLLWFVAVMRKRFWSHEVSTTSR